MLPVVCYVLIYCVFRLSCYAPVVFRVLVVVVCVLCAVCLICWLLYVVCCLLVVAFSL